MRQIMVLNAKGGSGKTTLATNLASYYASKGANVVLADFDPQGGSMAWLAARSAARPPIKGVAAHKDSFRPSRNTDVVVMDAPAAVHGPALSDLVRRAETIIVPMLASPLDMRAGVDFIGELRANRRIASKQAKIGLVANRVRFHTNIYWDLDDFLESQKAPFLAALRDSQNYIRAAERGLGVFDMAPYATDVDREQWAPVIKWLNSARSLP